MSDLASPLIARLDGVIHAGDDRWMARCPAHEDKSPSLSIREQDGRVLVNCFAGCDPDDILTAVALEWRDLYPDRDHCAQARPSQAARKALAKIAAATDRVELARTTLKIAAEDRRRGGRIPSRTEHKSSEPV